jgi:hypothetical protein
MNMEQLTNPKIEKQRAEIGKTKAKITELKARLREQEKQLRALEDTEIVALYRSERMSDQDLKTLRLPETDIAAEFENTEDTVHDQSEN